MPVAAATRSSMTAGGGAGLLEAEGHVVADGEVRVERVGLEDHGDLALARAATRLTPPAVDQDVAGGGVLEAGDDAQKRGLAAAGGADEDAELAVARPRGRRP